MNWTFWIVGMGENRMENALSISPFRGRPPILPSIPFGTDSGFLKRII
jgi:hypothetical protein